MIVLFFLVLLFFSNVHSINIDDSEFNSTLQVIPEKSAFFHNNNFYFGIKIELEDGWKTYWKNPGDAGSAIKLDLKNKVNILEYEVLFPFPKYYSDHEVKTIGYEKEIIFPVKFRVSDINKNITADANIEYLICKEICIPINDKYRIELNLKKKKPKETENLILKYLEKVPKKNLSFFEFDDFFIKDENTFYAVLDNPQKKNIEIFPFSSETNLSIKSIKLGKKTKIYIETEDKFEDLEKPIELSLSNGKFIEQIELNLKTLSVKENVIKFLILAFLGGFILNFMPCVFPVLSVKVMSMIQLKQFDKLKIKKLSFFVIIGILFSFIILASILILLKSFGIFVGWGFQFQNIYFLCILSLIILLFSLNLLGFFEIILPNSFINYFSKHERRESFSGYFFSGMFATLMATPCSAPFLGTAIGFASLTSNFNIFLIFLFISLGFSIPYFLLIFKPSLLNLLPKPGKWMIGFKYFLGVILLLTVFWLLTVIKVNILINFSLVISILFFSILINKKDNKISLSYIIPLILCLIFFFLYSEKKENLVWEKFDENLISDHIDNNNLIFVDFTADWCVTCKFNKFTTLDNQEVINYFLKNNVKLIRGDWTKKDENILNFIKKYERFGVPVNIIYSKNMKEGLVLPEILSKSVLIDNFERIKGK